MRFRSFLLLLFPIIATAQPKTDDLLRTILGTASHPIVRRVADSPEVYRLQIIYTQVHRDKKNRPAFHHYYYHYDPLLYFNPASMVKLPLAVLALEKLATIPGVDRNTTIQFDSSQSWQRPLYRDTTAADGRPTIAHLIKRALLVSENDPYNRLYQFVGQQGINQRLWEMGHKQARITRQFMGLTPEQNRYTNAVRFLDKMGGTSYTQPAAYNPDSFPFGRRILLGRGHLNRNDSLVMEPFDFTPHNNLSLLTLQQVLQSVLFPEAVPVRQRFQLKEDDRRFLLQYLSQYPSETPDPKYDTAKFYDSYVKFFFRDSTRRMPPGVRVFNKVGWAYGFLTDVSYVVDFNNGVEYMLAATLYVNSDGILNDGKYEYTSVGWPFLYQLGQAVYRYELQRPRGRKPDLKAFRVPYEKRDPRDGGKVLREVDN